MQKICERKADADLTFKICLLMCNECMCIGTVYEVNVGEHRR